MTMCTKIVKSLITLVIIMISMSDNINCSSVCESVAPNGIYRGSCMYRHWSTVKTGHLDQLMLYTRVNTTTTHEWQLIINETTVSVNELTFKSLNTPIVYRFGAIFRFQYLGIRIEDSYYCYSTFTDPNGDDSKSDQITKCEIPKQHSNYSILENRFDIQYPANAIIFSPRVVKWTEELDLTYHMVYDKRNNKCVKLLHIKVNIFKIKLLEMGCNECKEPKCKQPIFLDQLNQQLHQSLESIVDYGSEYYILIFVINGRPLYCWQLQDHLLNETCKSSKTMSNLLPNCVINEDKYNDDNQTDNTIYVIILIVLVIIAVIFAVIDIVLIGKRYRQQKYIIGQQWSTEEQTIHTMLRKSSTKTQTLL
ncbi:uncharacterized protein LOC128957769 [Oppia nitens]|uniref:uncharacterized protein LOC128957769 n=1 Tax=Oppia nitens TaxID=1686743 RepID=UPI0023D9FB95|nr:uncharacterized protein LOC128957769 [Oppia nitens]